MAITDVYIYFSDVYIDFYICTLVYLLDNDLLRFSSMQSLTYLHMGDFKQT